MMACKHVIPAEAAISRRPAETSCEEIPAFAGMTVGGRGS